MPSVLNVSGKDEFLEIRSTPRESLTGAGAVPPASVPPSQRLGMDRMPAHLPARAPCRTVGQVRH